MAFETILLDIHGKVGLITLNRPQALNALNAQIVGEINQALDQQERDANIGCVVLTGSAKAFAAGADIKEMAELQYPQIYVDDLFSDADRIANRRKPIIAAVSGFALGAGDDVRFHPRRRQCQIRPTGNQPWRTAGHGRHAAPDTGGGQGQGDGAVPDRSPDGR